MLSSRLQFSILVVAVSFAAGSVEAADYSPPQCYDAALIASGRAPYGAVPCYVPPPPVEEFSSWYLRGDIGISNQQVKSLDNLLSVPGTFTTPNGYGFDSAGIFGIGVGYYYNDWLRFDLTGEYRSRANFHGLEVFNAGYTDEYSGSKSEWLFLVNSYIDLGTWSGFTPFVGAGIGMSRNTIHGFQDVNTPTGGVAFADDQSKWNFAWALHAGVSYKVTKNFTVELAYRYVNLGDAVTGDLIDYQGNNIYNNPTTFNHLTSHDIKLGLRFNFDGFGSSSPAYYAPAPVVYQPQVYQPAPVYAPPPVYVQPPLRSRG